MINMYLKLILLLFITTLVACSSATGPVKVRESTRTTESSTDSAVVQPVVPSQRSNGIPLIERLVTQSYQALDRRNYQVAINTAERGLRVDRKEARFYWVLAQSYKFLQNQQQSIYFAKQGLRYASKKEVIYGQLQSLSR